jgi:iron only hydrogenase large subunit-like protein
MPCFDKKLEASREELTDLTWNDAEGRTKGVRDVDCVITSKEVLMLADSRGIEFSALPRVPLPQTSITPFPDAKLGSFLFPPSDRRWANGKPVAGPSGGGLYFTLQYILALNPGSSIQVERGRNADVVEYSVTSASGDTIFKAARYYGFRNIQNLVRKLKPAKVSRMPGSRPLGGARKPGAKSGGPDHAYVEVMACPGGCTNGGGQIKVDDPVVSGRRYSETKASPQDQKEWLALVDEAYFSADESGSEDETMVESSEDGLVVDGISFSHIKDILAYWSDLTGIDLHRLAYTSYRAVVSDVGKDTSHTERVVQLAGKIGGGW